LESGRAAELCRRQIAIHELIAQAAITGERRLRLTTNYTRTADPSTAHAP